MPPRSGIPGRPLLPVAEPVDVEAVETDGDEAEPAEAVARPLEKSGSPAVLADDDPCCPPLADGMPPDEELDDELDEELDDELDEELEDDGIDDDDDDGIDGGGVLLDCV